MRTPNSFQEQQGYFTFAQNTPNVNYLELAYYQACSIKQTQKINSYAVAVDAATKELITDAHRNVFDYIIDSHSPSQHAMSNEWQAWHLTPFKETIKLESDLLFTTNIDHWWTGMRHQEVCFTTKIRDYKGNISTTREYRKFFDDNLLPDIYTGLYYFRFGQISMELFSTAQMIYEQWPVFRDNILNNCREDLPSTDLVFAVAAMLLGSEKCTLPALDYPSFVHMKGAVNNLHANTDWRDAYLAELDGTDIYIGSYRQQWPVHYYQKDFINDRFKQELTRGLGKL